MKITKVALVAMLMASGLIFAQDKHEENNTKWTSGRPDGHAPISVMGDHVHHTGEWMFAYRFMYMNMEGLRSGASEVSSSSVLEKYMVTPQNMEMNMHMLGVMFAPSDKLTLMGMTNVTSNNMDLQTRMGQKFSTESSGFGDVRISALYQLFNKDRQSLHGELGVSLPTGSIEEKDVTPASEPDEMLLPYPMQTGSGSVDGLAGITYLAQGDFVSFGSQLKSTLRFGDNDKDYHLGNLYKLNTWLAYKAADWISFSGRLEGLVVEEIKGENPQLNKMMVTTADPKNSGGKYITSGLGINTLIPSGSLKNLRFAMEYNIPLYQDVNGVQLKTKNTLMFGVQYSFH